jgi:hypothetical protein
VFSAGLSRFGTASDSSFQCKSAHQETVLLRRYVTCFSGIPWPLETAVKGKAFINEYKTVTFLSEYSDKKVYPKTFVIRTYLKSRLAITSLQEFSSPKCADKNP